MPGVKRKARKALMSRLGRKKRAIAAGNVSWHGPIAVRLTTEQEQEQEQEQELEQEQHQEQGQEDPELESDSLTTNDSVEDLDEDPFSIKAWRRILPGVTGNYNNDKKQRGPYKKSSATTAWRWRKAATGSVKLHTFWQDSHVQSYGEGDHEKNNHVEDVRAENDHREDDHEGTSHVDGRGENDHWEDYHEDTNYVEDGRSENDYWEDSSSIDDANDREDSGELDDHELLSETDDQPKDMAGDLGRAILTDLDKHFEKKKVNEALTLEMRMKLDAVRFYLRGLQAGYDAKALRKLIAVMHGKSRWFAAKLEPWATEFHTTGTIQLSQRGKHQKKDVPIQHEDVRQEIISALRTENYKYTITPIVLQRLVNQNQFTTLPTIKICYQTARRWLKHLGWEKKDKSQGLYNDGHEREDVVVYRKKFLSEMESIERRMMRLPGIRPKDLQEGERPLVFYTHDESSYSSNDDSKFGYFPKGEKPFYRKGTGQTLMVTEFMSELDGAIKDVRKIIHIGKTRDGYWDGALMAQQLDDLLSYHAEKYPDYDAVVAFDNARIHQSYAKDALNAYRMNMNSGGKNEYRPHGMWYMQNGMRIEQAFLLDDGRSKGIKQVLQEREIAVNGLAGKCRKCPERAEDSDDRHCCLTMRLHLQPDFREQGTQLEEVIKKHQFASLIHYPRFHCELNYIEMYWGMTKRFSREHCDYSLPGLKRTVPLALDSVPIESIRRFAARSFRYMQAYREGLTGMEAEKQMKQYTSHRRISERLISSTNDMGTAIASEEQEGSMNRDIPTDEPLDSTESEEQENNTHSVISTHELLISIGSKEQEGNRNRDIPTNEPLDFIETEEQEDNPRSEDMSAIVRLGKQRAIDDVEEVVYLDEDTMGDWIQDLDLSNLGDKGPSDPIGNIRAKRALYDIYCRH